MIKPRSIIARIGVGLAIVAGLSMGAPAASFAQDEFDTSQVSSISQSADAGIATCKNNEDRDFAFQCSGTSATGYRQKEDSSSVYTLIQGYSGRPLRLYVDGAYNNRGTGTMNCTQGVCSYSRGLTAWAESGYGTVYGRWSPDCLGHFNKLPS